MSRSLWFHVLLSFIFHYLTGSQDSLVRGDNKTDKKRRGDKDRNSMVLGDRSQSESAKDKGSYDKRVAKGHKRQRSWGGNKLLEVEISGERVMDIKVVYFEYVYLTC